MIKKYISISLDQTYSSSEDENDELARIFHGMDKLVLVPENQRSKESPEPQFEKMLESSSRPQKAKMKVEASAHKKTLPNSQKKAVQQPFIPKHSITLAKTTGKTKETTGPQTLKLENDFSVKLNDRTGKTRNSNPQNHTNQKPSLKDTGTVQKSLPFSFNSIPLPARNFRAGSNPQHLRLKKDFALKLNNGSKKILPQAAGIKRSGPMSLQNTTPIAGTNPLPPSDNTTSKRVKLTQTQQTQPIPTKQKKD